MSKRRNTLGYFFLILGLALLCSPRIAITADVAAPEVKVESVRRAFHNGEHNAFTDLIRFNGRFYLTFRSCPDGHMVHPTSSIIVLSSEDGLEWERVHRFSVPKRDVRDPHFLAFNGRLFVYTGTWYCGDSSPEKYDMNQLLGYGVWSQDGRRWSQPQMLEGTYGHYAWRAASYGGKAYLCGRRKSEFRETKTREEHDVLVESALLESDDGLIFRKAGLFQERYGNETAFLFEDDGSILAVARSGGRRNAQVLRSKPPYQQWDRTDLDRYIGGPLVAKWGKRYLVGGRKIVSGEPRTTLYWLLNDALSQFAELPSAGDNSYPGFVARSPNRGLISYYSTHEKNSAGDPITAIYLAELTIEP
jgi:hypothetical protein